MNNHIDLAESSEEEEDFGLCMSEEWSKVVDQVAKNIKAVQDREQANIQARLNTKAETEVNHVQVSSSSSLWTAPESACAPASAVSILLDSAPIITGGAASSSTFLQHDTVGQDYDSSGPPLVLPSVAMNIPIAQHRVENTNIAAETDANIWPMADETQWPMQFTFGPEALGVTSSDIESGYYWIQCLRGMADEMETQMQTKMQLLYHMDRQSSYINEEQSPGDGGAGLGESNTSMAVSLEEGGANDLAHVDINRKGKEIPRSQDPLENKRLRKEHFAALSAKKQFNYQWEFQ